MNVELDTQSPLRVVRSVICEDVRVEADGRCSLMGVTTGHIQFDEVVDSTSDPKMDLAFYIECEVKGVPTASFRFLAPDGKTVLKESSGQFSGDDTEGNYTISPVIVARDSIRFPQSGEYSLEGRYDGGNWEKIAGICVTINKLKA